MRLSLRRRPAKGPFDRAIDELLRRQRLRWMAALCAFLNVADMCLSLHLFGRYEGLEEGNPLMAYVLSLGRVPFIVVKLSLGNCSIIVLYWLAMRGSRFAERGLIGATLVLSVVVYLGLTVLVWFSQVY